MSPLRGSYSMGHFKRPFLANLYFDKRSGLNGGKEEEGGHVTKVFSRTQNRDVAITWSAL